MIQEFVPYVEALVLKELGFDEPCFGYWSNYGVKEPFLLSCEYDNEIESSYIRRKPFLCKAPLYQQAFKWFRYHFDISSDIVSRLPFYNNFDSEGNIEDGELKWEYNYRIIHNKDGYKCEVYESNILNNFTHYEEFEEAELECLRKLIGIVKNK